MNTRQLLGRAGERAAADLLVRKGFTILDRNWTCDAGEMDLVARKGDLVVFCEVKTRRTDTFGIPAEAVGWQKQQRLRRIAAAWLAWRRPPWVDIRFDVVSVVARGTRTEVTHIPGAF